MAEYIRDIIKSFQEISNKDFILNLNQDDNPFKISKLIDINYGIRNFIGNANKFAKNKIYISIKVIMKIQRYQSRMMDQAIRKIF